MARTLLRAALVALTVGLGGCRAIVGVEDRAPPEEPVECVELAGLEGACADCAAAACCGEVEACGAEAACGSRQACVGACAGDPTCRAACDDVAPAGEASDALGQCLAASCSDACGLACGGAGPPVLGCAPCGEACCAEATASALDDDSLALRACRRACPDGDVGCRERCRDVHPVGADLEQSVDTCVARACQVVEDWSCLGRIEPPTTSSAYLELTVFVYVDDPPGWFEGATVEACAPGSDCAHPLAGGVTDANGSVQLRLPIAAGSFDGFLRVGGEGLVTTSTFSSRPRVTGGILALYAFAESTLADLLESNGLTLAPGRGITFVATYDCRDRRAAGVVLHGETTDGEVPAIYANSPSGEIATDRTADAGGAVFLDVPPGYFSVAGDLASLCAPMGAATVRVTAGEVTSLDLFPTR